MFRDRSQANRAARVLLGTLELDHLWDDSGPTERAEELIAEDGGPLAPPEAALLLATDVLCGNGTPQPRELTLRTLLRDLPPAAIRAFLGLVLASQCSGAHIDAWMILHGARQRSQVARDAPPPTKVSPAPAPAPAAAAGTRAPGTRAELQEALRASLREFEEPNTHRIPLVEVVRRLETSGWPRADIHRELIKASRDGELDLFPALREGLLPDEADALPVAFRGSVYVTAFRAVRWRDPCAQCGLMAQAPVHDEHAIGDAAHAFRPRPSGEGCS